MLENTLRDTLWCDPKRAREETMDQEEKRPRINYHQFDDGSSIALPNSEQSRKDPLVGYGDPVSVGDWVQITYHSTSRSDPGPLHLPQRIVSISPENPPNVAYAIRKSYTFFGAMGVRHWLTFRKIALICVPRYLREPLAFPHGVTRSDLRQLTKQQILSEFAGKTEVESYVVVLGNWYGHPVIRQEIMPLTLGWEQKRGQRMKLVNLQPKYASIDKGFELLSASEQEMEPDGRIFFPQRPRHIFRLYDVDGQGQPLMDLLSPSNQ